MLLPHFRNISLHRGIRGSTLLSLYLLQTTWSHVPHNQAYKVQRFLPSEIRPMYIGLIRSKTDYRITQFIVWSISFRAYTLKAFSIHYSQVSIPMAFTTHNLLHIGSSFLPRTVSTPKWFNHLFNAISILCSTFIRTYVSMHPSLLLITPKGIISFTCSTLSSITLIRYTSCFPTLIAMSYASLRSFPPCQLLQIVL